MPGIISTNIARTLIPRCSSRSSRSLASTWRSGPANASPTRFFEKARVALIDFIARPDDVADAVLFAIGQPAGVHIAEIVARPYKDLQL